METNLHAGKSSYRMLGWMMLVHFIYMYIAMYSMVYSFGEVYLNSNTFYMTALMVAPMSAAMILMMSSMYKNRSQNIVWIVGSVGAFILFWTFMRTQAFVGDKQFVRAMIPHHSGALLMCGKAQLSDPELILLCKQIIEGQESEISQMKRILDRL